MYIPFYGLREKPFKLVPDPRFLYMSEAHQAAISHLQYGLEERNGFVVITGEVGSGKTLLLRVLMSEIPPTTHVARIINTNFNAKELLEHILNEFGIETQKETKPKMISLLTQFLLRGYSEQREIILVIDEAQNLSIDALEELRMVSNLETNTEKLIQIVMVGQPQLRYKLNLPDLEQLRQRVTVQYHIPALSKQDTVGYVNHRLAVARGEGVEIFTPAALERIYEYSKGVPRLINVVSDAALRLGYVEEKKLIDEKILDEVIRELREIEVPLAKGRPAREETAASLDVNIMELNQKFQDLYDQMQKIYVRKDEESQLVYERLLNMEKEMAAKESLYNLQERERMMFEKEREIHQKLLEVSGRLDEVNALKESLEEKRLEVHSKASEIDERLNLLQEEEVRAARKQSGIGSHTTGETNRKGALGRLEETQRTLQEREKELAEKMEEVKGFIGELEQKKAFLDTLGQEKSLGDRLRDLEERQEVVRRNEEELVSKIGLLERRIRPHAADASEEAADRPDTGLPGVAGQEAFLVDLISLVDRLKSEMDSLALQKQLLQPLQNGKTNVSGKTEEKENGDGSRTQREEELIQRMGELKRLFKIVEEKTGAVDVMTGKFLKRERLLEQKFDELKAMILRIETAGAPAEKRDGKAERDGAEERVSDASDWPERAASGRRFNAQIRKILKES